MLPQERTELPLLLMSGLPIKIMFEVVFEVEYLGNACVMENVVRIALFYELLVFA